MLSLEAKKKKARDLERQLDEIIRDPKSVTVGEFSALQREYSDLLYQIETESNLTTKQEKVASCREAVAKLVNVIYPR